MTIEKGGKIYQIKELTNEWKLVRAEGCVTLEYKVSKADAPSLETLREYVAKESAVF